MKQGGKKDGCKRLQFLRGKQQEYQDQRTGKWPGSDEQQDAQRSGAGGQ